mgnify:CR=1 FL=1
MILQNKDFRSSRRDIDGLPQSQFLKEHPETMISLLYLDFLLYEPSKVALENFLPRMPENSIIAFNTLTDPKWPGTMHAVFETLGINDKKFKRFSFNPYIQYLVL